MVAMRKIIALQNQFKTQLVLTKIFLKKQPSHVKNVIF